ncbi:hypothetical protein DFH08DRAFT_799465 [Mycena albidolilacea]|uniref:Uncharacterized protein n=1 Tax=Mycena albidolilacea TaxID=1033008 RepID=A0AAD7ALR3_9AGAR|nr:hypothetical protein DFH08DRAFT_799465 [Mycena albidolilacea]
MTSQDEDDSYASLKPMRYTELKPGEDIELKHSKSSHCPFQPGGALDSQTTSQEYIENLVGSPEMGTDAFDSQPALPKREMSEEPLSYEELRDRCLRAEEKLDRTLFELRDTRNAFQRQRLRIIDLENAARSSVTVLAQAIALINSSKEDIAKVLEDVLEFH